MTRCGHIFCWPCILGLASSSVPSTASADAMWKQKCPICSVPVDLRKHLKSVLFEPIQAAAVGGETRTFCLVKRLKTNPALFASSDNAPFYPKISPWSSAELLERVFLLEEAALSKPPEPDFLGGPPEVLPHWSTSLALDLLSAHISGLCASLGTSPDHPKEPAATLGGREEWPTAWWFFYQAEDGSPLFLDTLSIRMLRAAFGSYHSFPPKLTCPIISVSEIPAAWADPSMPYLAHLPIGLSARSVVPDLSQVIPPGILGSFSGELHERLSHSFDSSSAAPIHHRRRFWTDDARHVSVAGDGDAREKFSGYLQNDHPLHTIDDVIRRNPLQ